MSELRFTRADYMNRLVSHDDYYDQFVNAVVVDMVSRRIGAERVKASADPHFNDIPLREWDRLADTLINSNAARLVCQATGWNGTTLAERVCVLKAAARRIRGVS